MTIKKLKKVCWIVICDECGEEVFRTDEYNSHFATKKEAMDMIEIDNIEQQEGKHFCDTECWRRHYKYFCDTECWRRHYKLKEAMK